MTDILALLNRFENAAGVYERSDDPAARDELHAARRAIVEQNAKLFNALSECLDWFRDREDADHNGNSSIPNEEMKMALMCLEALK